MLTYRTRGTGVFSATVEEKLKATKLFTPRDEALLSEFNIPIQPPKRPIPSLVCWQHPQASRLKLNVDGASRGNLGLAGARGVLRDLDGKLIMAFSTTIGTCTNNYAKLMGLLHCLRIVKNMGVVHLDVELDSLLVVKWLKE